MLQLALQKDLSFADYLILSGNVFKYSGTLLPRDAVKFKKV